MKNIKGFLFKASVVLCGSIFLSSCEPEADNLGEQFFNPIEGVQEGFDVVAYNISNKDSIESGTSRLGVARLGAFSEGVFGMQRASYVTQVRMATYDPSFGANATVDSVVMVLTPEYAADSATTKTNEDYIFPEGSTPAKLERTTYPVKKYGNKTLGGAPAVLNIKVHEVTDFLGGATDRYYSNAVVGLGAEIGALDFTGNATAVKITKDSDNSSLFTSTASVRIPLSTAFFQNKIIAHQGSVDMKDAAGFIRYFRGVRLSVTNTDGYLFGFQPSTAEIIMYYKYDKVENGTTTRPQTTFKFPLGPSNAHIGQYEYNRTGTPLAAVVPGTPNESTGDAKLYLQGMGGPSVGIKLTQSSIEALRSKFLNDKIGIISAKIRMYTDTSIWNNSYQKPQDFTILQQGEKKMLSDYLQPDGVSYFPLIRTSDLTKNPAYYDVTVTKTLKEIVETEASNKTFILDVGSFLVNENGVALGYRNTTRAYMPHRVVLVGTDAGNANRIQLMVTYGKK